LSASVAFHSQWIHQVFENIDQDCLIVESFHQSSSLSLEEIMFCRALIISLNDLTFDSLSRASESSVHVVMSACLGGLLIDFFAFCFFVGCCSGVYPCFTGVRSNHFLLSDSVISFCVFTKFITESCT